MHRKDRGSKGGGVALLFKERFKILRMPDIANIEGIFCKAYHGSIRYVLGALYRPPNSSPDFFALLQSYLIDHVKPGDRLILGGDFNMPHVDWPTFTLNASNDKLRERLFDMIFSFDLRQVVEEFTRIQGNCCSILDLLFLSGSLTGQAKCEVLPGISDHSAVLLTLSSVSMAKSVDVTSVPNFSRADDVAILDMLSFSFDSFQDSSADIHTLWNQFKDLVNDCTQRFVPCLLKKGKGKSPWISRDTLQLKRRLKGLKTKRGTARDLNALLTKISELSSELKTKVSSDKQNYFGEKLPKFISTSPEKFWRLISPSKQINDTFMVNGVLSDDNAVIAEAFNLHFRSVFTHDNGSMPYFHASYPPLSDVTINENGILNMLLNLDIKKSPGPDGLPNEFLKRYAPWVSKYLHVLFSKSLTEGEIPIDWRTAAVKPIFKNGNKQHILNYRPISLISTSCKLLEHIIHNHIAEFLSKNKILSCNQHGFRKGFSTCTQLVTTVHDFAKAINSGKQVDAIFKDFAKAFDKVSHKKLLHKLDVTLGNAKIVTWISTYLTNRQQYVSFKNRASKRLPVDSGVPQGSVLGPLLFLLFINDIGNDIPVKIKLYADDCVMYSEIDSVSDQLRLNEAFEKIVKWCNDWQMTINFDKTVFMKISRKRSNLHFQYSARNILLAEVEHIKYLGIWISNDLRWTKHINTVCNSANQKLFFLRRALRLTTPEVRLLAFNAIVQPVLDYASVIWYPFTKKDIDKIEGIQKRAVRYIYNSFVRTSMTDLLNRANLPTLTQRNRVLRLKFLFQLVKGHYSIDISELFSFSTGYATRQRHALTITPFTSRNNCFKYSFFPRVVTEWNQLSNDAVLQPSLNLFMSNIA